MPLNLRLNWRTLLALIALLAMVATACASDEDDATGAADPTEPAAAEVTEDPALAETEMDPAMSETEMDPAMSETEMDPAMSETEMDPAMTETEMTESAGGGGGGEMMSEEDMADLSGSIEIDGSSTVGPLTDAIAEEFASVAPDVTVNIGISGTGGGFERFCGEGSTDISNASRPIKDEEAQLCEDNGINFTEVRVGTDALTMVTAPGNDFLTCLTQEELVTLWGPDAASSWDQVNPEFPAEAIEIFAPDADSGTYDFFNETILEPNDIEAPRQDYNSSADDNIIAQGVEGTQNSWGYFGFAYFVNEGDRLQAIEYAGGDGCVGPSVETAQDDSYGLTRPLFIYVKNESLAQPHVEGFVTYYLNTVNSLIEQVGYVPAPEEVIDEAKATVQAELG